MSSPTACKTQQMRKLEEFQDTLMFCHTELYWLQEGNLPHHSLCHRLQVNLCSGSCSTFSPSFFTALGVYRVVSLGCPPSSLPVFPLLKFIITDMLPPSIMYSALASDGSILEAAVIDSIRYGGSFYQLFTEVNPLAPMLQNLAINSNTCMHLLYFLIP